MTSTDPGDQPAGLGPVLAAWAAGAVDAERLQAAFDAATLYVQRVLGADGRPAIAAYGRPGAGHVAFYSSLEAMAAAVGECDWAGARGRDLVDLVPDGYGLVLDPVGPHLAALPAPALRRGVVLTRTCQADASVYRREGLTGADAVTS